MRTGHMSIRDISRAWDEELRGGEEPSYWRVGDLLDDFRQRCPTPEEKYALVRDAPVWLEAGTHPDCNAYLAAVAETLCREAFLNPPGWSDASACFLHRPWFAGGFESLKALLLVESPVAFRRRNLFVSANALSRA